MIFFFLNRFNDIDHIAPVIYKVAKETKYKITIISINIFIDIESDFRINYIKNKYPNIVITNLLLSTLPLPLSKFLSFIFSKKNKPNKIYLRRIIIKLLNKISFVKLLENIFLTEEKVYRFVNNKDPFLIVLDHAITVRLPGMKYVLQCLNKHNIPILSLPHGLSISKNHNDPDFDIAKQDMANSAANHIVFNTKTWRDECIKAGLNKNKTYLLGSARYCREWKKSLDSIIQWDISKRDGNNRLKVVFMDRGKQARKEHYVFIQEAIDELSKLDFIEFVFKPQTRANKVNFSLNNIEVVSKYNSVDIINWADVVIGNNSSILVEAIIQNKIIISPKHHKSKETLIEMYDACVKVNSNKEIIDVLQNIHYNNNHEFNLSAGRRKFLDEIIKFDEDILSDYIELINNIVLSK